MKSIVPVEIIERKIYVIRGLKVMLSNDLADLYGVEPRVFVQAVKRNIARFPEGRRYCCWRKWRSERIKGGGHRLKIMREPRATWGFSQSCLQERWLAIFKSDPQWEVTDVFPIKQKNREKQRTALKGHASPSGRSPETACCYTACRNSSFFSTNAFLPASTASVIASLPAT